MNQNSPSTLWVHLQADGAWGGRFTDAERTFEVAKDCPSAQAVEEAAAKLGLQPEHVEMGRLSLAYERRMLEKADRDVATARDRFRDQARRVKMLEKDGQDATQGRRVLRTFNETVWATEGHRQQIVEQIDRLEARNRSAPAQTK